MSIRIAELYPGDRVISSRKIGPTTEQMPLIVLGSSKNNDSVILLAERGLGLAQMNPWWNAGDYFHSAIDDYLEDIFADSLSQTLKQVLVATEICVNKSTALGEVLVGNSRRVFLPSMCELGFETPYLEGISYISALKQYHRIMRNDVARIALVSGSSKACFYWTRSSDNDNEFHCVMPDGCSCIVSKENYDIRIRPCFSVSVEAEVAQVTVSGSSYYKLTGMRTRRAIQGDLFVQLMTL